MTDCIQNTLQTTARIPRSTYRLQMHQGFTFADAQAVLPYLQQLGIGDAYASPIFEARPGSMHGYDVTRHDRLNPELGGMPAFQPFAAALQAAGMGLLLDIVPNHMGVGNDSVWWQDVLENGRASRYSGYFDIDWTPLKQDMQHKLLLPILGNQYGVELEDGNIQVKFEDGQARIAYYDHLMPIAPRTFPTLFPPQRDAEVGGPPDFRALLDELAALPPHESTEEKAIALRRERLAVLKPRLHTALASPTLAPVLQKAAAAINGTKGAAPSFDALHALLDMQPYRLASWKTSSEQINYRRFFDVNDLVGLRMENPAVFAETHSLLRALLANRQITGLRIDHCDGMFNPRTYLVRLQELFVASQCCGPVAHDDATPSGVEQPVLDASGRVDWANARLPLYCVVEKILEPGEVLPRDWPVQGTSGYDFVHFATQLFIQPKNQKRFNTLYADILGERMQSEQVLYDSKRKIMESSLSSETHVLTNLLSQLAGADRRARDLTNTLLERVIRETIACFPIYRTYIDERGHYSDHDRETIEQAIQKARRRAPELDASAFDFLERVLLLGGRPGFEHDEEYNDAQLYFALKFQQLTGPVMAKSVEDTSFYVYNRFISSNEVGSSMEAFGIRPEVLHQANAERQRITPHTMLTTSTHDTKRSEDVRCRLNVLSEMPDEWASRIRQWQQLNARHKRSLSTGQLAPDANEEYLLYQTIVGVWPWQETGTDERGTLIKRLQDYMTKALSEAKVNLSWVTPNPEYTTAVTDFVSTILSRGDDGKETPFVTDLLDFLNPVRRFGAVNSLALLTLKATVPGVPDFYQGCDMWDLSLVDPDNRRPIDYQLRTRALADMLQSAADHGPAHVAADTLTTLEDGRAKLWAMHRVLAIRNEHLAVFEQGAYTPLSTTPAEKDENVFAYLRGDQVAVLLPRFSYRLAGDSAGLALGSAWDGITVTLPQDAASRWVNIFTGEELAAEGGKLALAEVFRSFPVAVLVRAS
ncbi:MAG TPA: malto-oligosyltrehalose synthase [Acidobacteriaceae bacterium]